MNTKPKINPSSTYILDEAEIEQLDELSLTSMVTALVEAVPEDCPEAANDFAVPLRASDAAINNLLATSAAQQQPALARDSTEPEASGDLLPAHVVFPELTPDRRQKLR